MKLLIVVDVQKDFVDGALGTPEAVAMVPALMEKVQNFDGTILITKDTHGDNYMATQEGEKLPVPHCIKGTEGWELYGELRDFAAEKNLTVYEKPCFGSRALADALRALAETETIESIELVGLCTDICVVSNALLIKAALPEVPVFVDARCCAGVTPEKHEAALQVMESCQITITR